MFWQGSPKEVMEAARRCIEQEPLRRAISLFRRRYSRMHPKNVAAMVEVPMSMALLEATGAQNGRSAQKEGSHQEVGAKQVIYMVTLSDVAREGVSIVTVSRVINSSPGESKQ